MDDEENQKNIEYMYDMRPKTNMLEKLIMLIPLKRTHKSRKPQLSQTIKHMVF